MPQFEIGGQSEALPRRVMMQPAVDSEKFVHRGVEVLIIGELNVSANVPGKGLVVDERGYQSAGLTRFQQPPGGATLEFLRSLSSN